MIVRYLMTLMMVSMTLFANNVDDILMDMEVNNDLSARTKKENNGIVYVYTRSDL
ncbi:MAG: hypothetical protein RLZZ428_804, partial [Pseudomonadota bacterium]